jgi:hypothetical protein
MLFFNRDRTFSACVTTWNYIKFGWVLLSENFSFSCRTFYLCVWRSTFMQRYKITQTIKKYIGFLSVDVCSVCSYSPILNLLMLTSEKWGSPDKVLCALLPAYLRRHIHTNTIIWNMTPCILIETPSFQRKLPLPNLAFSSST